jgi:hypothetical protein
MGAGIAKDAKDLSEVDEDGVARRQLARLLRSIFSGLWPRRRTGERACALPAWGRALMAQLLLLPAGHPAASAASTAAADRARELMLAAMANPHPRIGSAGTNDGWSDAAQEAERLLVDLGCQSARFTGPYAFRAPGDLRHSILPRAHLLVCDMLKYGETHFGEGPRFLRDMIELCSNPPMLALCDAVWRPGMAAWTVAVAQACGGFPSPDSEADYVALARSLAPTPFLLLCLAVRQAPAMAHAMLDIPPESPFAFDVDNRRGQVITFVDDASSCTSILHLQIARFGNASPSETPLPDPALFRRLVQRSSDATLNALQNGHFTALHSLVAYCCRWTFGETGPVRPDCMPIALEMALALLERAEPDGCGVDLDTAAPCGTHLPGFFVDCAAYDALVGRHGTQCYQCLVGRHGTQCYRCRVDRADICRPGEPRCHLMGLIRAFEAAFDRRKGYAAGLVPMLGAALRPQTAAPAASLSTGTSALVPAASAGCGVGGMPVPDIVKLVASFLLRTTPQRALSS